MRVYQAAIIVTVTITFYLGGMSWLFCVLWNWIAADLFDAPLITYWQAMGLFVLINIISGIASSAR